MRGVDHVPGYTAGKAERKQMNDTMPSPEQREKKVRSDERWCTVVYAGCGDKFKRKGKRKKNNLGPFPSS